jgi:hypothetical protein
MKSRLLTIAVTVSCLAVATVAYAQHTASEHQVFTPDAVKWGPAPPGLPPGAQVAVLSGDPAKPGPFTMRAKLPDGYEIKPHYHPADEHLTVIQGTFVIGMGEKFDKAAGKAMPAGTFGYMKEGVRHFAFTKGQTIIQLHGNGPWGITYVNAADDPRKKAGTD